MEEDTTEAVLYYRNEDGEEATYSAYIPTSRIPEILALMDKLNA